MNRRTGRAAAGGAGDRHADKVAALRRAVLDSDAVRPTTRAAAAGGGALPAPLETYLANVRDASFRITDADVAELGSAGYGDERRLSTPST